MIADERFPVRISRADWLDWRAAIGRARMVRMTIETHIHQARDDRAGWVLTATAPDTGATHAVAIVRDADDYAAACSCGIAALGHPCSHVALGLETIGAWGAVAPGREMGRIAR